MKPILCYLSMLLLVSTVTLQAFINPGFSPAHMVRSSGVIFTAELTSDGKEGWQITDFELIKGKLATPRLKLAAEGMDRLPAQGAIGKIVGFKGENEFGKPAYFVFAKGMWFNVDPDGETWVIKKLDDNMQGTYAGDPAMLAKLVAFLVANPDALVPTTVGTSWYHIEQIADLGAPASLALLADGSQGAGLVFVASEMGDRLFRVAGRRKIEDLSEAAGVTSKSRMATTLDIDGDGNPELLVWDGTGIQSWKFSDEKLVPIPDAAHELTSLLSWSPIRVDGVPGLVVFAGGTPSLLWWRDGKWHAEVLEDGGISDGEFSAPLVADLNHDGWPDILQPGSEAGRLWSGSAKGFGSAAACPVRAKGAVTYGVGDFNHDGWLDFYLNSEELHGLWENGGDETFSDVTERSGWFYKKSAANAATVFVADFNHNGRPDIAICSRGQPFQYHFNRGFRTFAEEGELRLPQIPEDHHVIGVLVEDFNGDGSQDLVVVTDKGGVFALFNDLYDLPAVRAVPGNKANLPLTIRSKSNEKSAGEMRSVHLATGSVHIPLPGQKGLIEWMDSKGNGQSLPIEANLTTETLKLEAPW